MSYTIVRIAQNSIGRNFQRLHIANYLVKNDLPIIRRCIQKITVEGF